MVFTKIADLVLRRARLVLVVAGLVLASAAALATGAMDVLKVGGFLDPRAPSSQATRLIDAQFGGRANLVFLIEAPQGSVDAPAARAEGLRLTGRLAGEPVLDNVTSYWSTGSPALKSADGRYAIVAVHVDGDENTALRRARGLYDTYVGTSGPLEITLGGFQGIYRDIFTQVMRSLVIAEAIAVPLTLVLLLAAFGSVVAALLPLAIGVSAIVGTFGLLRLLGAVSDVSLFAANLVTALGLGLGIDYALLIVARFRERLAAGDEVPQALRHTVRTAGRTVFFSAAIVMAALAAMLVFPLYFLRSFAYAGIGVVALAALAALFVVPALLALCGHRVNAGRLPWVRGVRGADAPFWARLARGVSRRPVLATLPVVAILLLAAAPLAGAVYGTPDERVLKPEVTSRQATAVLREEFPGFSADPVEVVVTPRVPDTALAEYARRLSRQPDVTGVIASVGTYADGRKTAGPAGQRRGGPAAQWLTVATGLPPKSDRALDLVQRIRDTAGPADARVVVGGTDAELLDTRAAIASRLPVAAAVIVVTTFVVLFLFTGSPLQPLRALLLNGLVLAATLGAMVWVFQYGHFKDTLGFTPQPTDATVAVLIFCVVFGLAMDYEVFVVARIKEMSESGLDTVTAVERGLAKTGRIVSTAAGLLAVSFLAFVTSSINFIQMFGLGAGTAILLDAVLVRGVLVPGTFALMGRTAWWCPRRLRPVRDRFAVTESEPGPPAPATVGPTTDA
ncbi:MMPL family transporter [Streptomyces sp. A012304]|uniref:MMPL family transporter n=1 Tax=Streptomyces sp. A012304 TaxID=375446 RepID=UPI00223155C8|nr:MMPL family transporter [Streptomyces sp. A012304]GKQ38958.1 membrane protein [Streptomyces sp. A012304]